MLLKKIKHHFNKKDHQVITIEEFAHYMGLKKEDVLSFICE
jgi:adenosylcobinamide amidohydrolase